MAKKQNIDPVEIGKYALLIGGVVLGYKILKDLLNAFSGGNYPEVTIDLENELNKLKSRGINPTISDSQASSYADYIEATNKSWNTNEDEIVNIFKVLKNNADLILLKIKFGTRRPQFETIYVGLSAFLRADLNNNYIQEINNILQSKNIQLI
jgi:hypothetical protein